MYSYCDEKKFVFLLLCVSNTSSDKLFSLRLITKCMNVFIYFIIMRVPSMLLQSDLQHDL